MKTLWLFLLAFLRPAIDDPAPDADPAPDEDPAPDADPQPELDLESPDEDPAPKVDPKAELETARREAKENKERAERFEREAAELRVRNAPRPMNDVEAQENARLASADITPLEKWQIESNRTLRNNTNASQMALAQARDLADKTAFSAIAMSDPVAKRYEASVEEELSKARAAGHNPTRESIYTYQLGRDMRAGKFKKKAAPASGGEKKTVDRGRLPGAKSDVTGKNGGSEREKRIARLENVRI